MGTFSEFKSSFYSRVTDFNVFNCQEFNLLKVVLDGLKVDYFGKMKYRPLVFKAGWYASGFNFIYRIKHRALLEAAKAKFDAIEIAHQAENLIIDSGRVAQNKSLRTVSIYFENIREELGAGSCYTLFQNRCSLNYGAVLPEIFIVNKYNNYSNEEKKVRSDLKKTFDKIRSGVNFTPTELKNIEIAFDKFFNDYRFWSYFLKLHGFKKSFFMPHYHNEGFILALKRNNIKAIEIQHGLIATEDIFYVFPKTIAPIAQRALFSDKIFTYGQYWVNKLLLGGEFLPAQIDIIGDYQITSIHITEEKQKLIMDFKGSKPCILVTTQTFLEAEFILYIAWLSNDLLKRGQDNKIIVKLHPAEKKADYLPLDALSNVLIVDANVDYLLSMCSYHISVYSTTLYTALKYGCKNYSLNSLQCQDYTSQLVKDGISVLLQFDQNPLSIPANDNAFEVSYYYDGFEKHKHKLQEC
ncbi:MAG: hypothetical protein V4635_13910 [Bacteroidota bacterium]